MAPHQRRQGKEAKATRRVEPATGQPGQKVTMREEPTDRDEAAQWLDKEFSIDGPDHLNRLLDWMMNWKKAEKYCPVCLLPTHGTRCWRCGQYRENGSGRKGVRLK